MSKVIPSDKFVLKILAEKEKGLTAKQIQTKHGVTPNQYKYIVYTLAKKLNQSSTFKSTKSAQSVTVSVASVTGASADVWEPMQKTVDFFYPKKEKKSLWKRLVSKIFFWYGKKA